MQAGFRRVRAGNIRPLQNHLGLKLITVVLGDHVGAGGRQPEIAVHANHPIAIAVLGVCAVDHAAALALKLDERTHVQAVSVVDGAAGIRCAHQHDPPLGQEPCGVHADRAEALDHQPCAVELQFRKLGGHFSRMTHAPAGGAQFVQRNSAQARRQADCAANLVVNPGHAAFIGAHVGSEDVFGGVAQRATHGPDQLLLVLGRGFGVAVQHALAAAVA